MSSQLGAISSVNALIGKVFTQPKGDLGDPITCWTPAEFPKVWADFVNQYCYVHGTYFSSLEGPLDYNKHERQRVSIDYYQWCLGPLCTRVTSASVLHAAICMEASQFFLRLRFTGGNTVRRPDLASNKIVKFSRVIARMEAMERQTAVYLWDGIRLSKRRHRGQLALHYVLYTLVQAINASLMFLWLNWLIDSPIYSWSGPSILVDFYNGLTWQETGHFPRITHCDFTRRKLASVQMETVLCVLTLNIYYEKLLLFLWFWMLFVAIISWLNCISWLHAMFLPHAARHRLQSLLTVHDNGASLCIDRFFRALGADGIFILQQIAMNVGELPTSYLSLAMYNVINNANGDTETQHLLGKAQKVV